MSDAPPPAPHHPARAGWRNPVDPAAPAPAASDRAGRRFLTALALLAVAGAAVGTLFWIYRPVPPRLVTVPVVEYTDLAFPPVPGAERDADRLRDCFPEHNEKAFDDQERDRLRAKLAALKSAGTDRPLVLHLTAAVATRDDAVFLLPGDAKAADKDSWLPLDELLDALAACPAKDKLLLLDVARPVADPFHGLLLDDADDRLHARLAAGPVPGLVLCSTSPGEWSLPLDDEGMSVFAYYLVEGLRGAADGYGEDGERDRRVSAKELAAFVRARVARWAERNRAPATQMPKLYGAAADFFLTFRERPAPEEASAGAPSVYPAKLSDGWARRDAWWADGSFRTAPAAFAHWQADLLRAEQVFEATSNPDRAATLLAGALADRQRQFETARPERPPPPRSLAAARAGPPPADLKEAFRKVVALRTAVPPPPPAEAQKSRDDFAAKAKAAPVAAAGLAWDELRDEPAPPPELVRDLSALVEQILPNTLYDETLLLRRVADWKPDVVRWPDEAVHQLFAAESVAEAALAQLPAGFPWVRTRLDEAERRRCDGERQLFAAKTQAAVAEARRLLGEAEAELRAVQQQLQTVREARQALEDAAVVLTGTVSGVVAEGGATERAWRQAAGDAKALAELLTQPPDGGRIDLDRWDVRVQDVRRSAAVLAAPYRPEAVKKAVAAAGPGAGPAEWQALRALLRGPLLKAADRKKVWEAARQLAHKLHQDTRKLDQDEDDEHRPTPAPRATSSAGTAAVARADRRAMTAGLLLQVAGMNGATPTGTAWQKLGDDLRTAWADGLPQQVRERVGKQEWAAADRLARFPPPPVRGEPPSERPPAAQLRRAEAEAYRTWLEGRYRALAELRAPARGAAEFYEDAAADSRSRLKD